MALFTTFMTTPTVMAIYKPARNVSSSSTTTNGRFKSAALKTTKNDEFRLLACVHGPGNIPALVNLIESTRSTTNSRLKLYLMHLVELTERSSSIVMVQRVRKNGFPFINRHCNRGELYDRVAVAFQAYTQLGQVSIQPVTAISALSTMHEDICHVAADKRVKMIILPFHKQWRKSDGDSELMVENAGHGWRGVNQRVLKDSPCSVGVLVDRGFSGGGGGGSGSGSGSASSGGSGSGSGSMLDEEAVAEFRTKWDGVVEYIEKAAVNLVE
ncbi:hypothetical protein C3L33_20272, partial [Rhododendron williamsianum]